MSGAFVRLDRTDVVAVRAGFGCAEFGPADDANRGLKNGLTGTVPVV